jgi:hypothetical protein
MLPGPLNDLCQQVIEFATESPGKSTRRIQGAAAAHEAPAGNCHASSREEQLEAQLKQVLSRAQGSPDTIIETLSPPALRYSNSDC